MCLEDILLMRKSRSSQYSKLVGLTWDLFIPQNKNRIALIIGAGVADGIRISLASLTNNTEGILLAASGPPFKLNLLYDGDIVTRQWYAISILAPVTIFYEDVVLEGL